MDEVAGDEDEVEFFTFELINASAVDGFDVFVDVEIGDVRDAKAVQLGRESGMGEVEVFDQAEAGHG